MKRILVLATLATLTFAPVARAEDEVDPALQEQLTTKLTTDGYEIRKVEMEDGLIEVYALKDGKQVELYFDGKLNLVKTVDG